MVVNPYVELCAGFVTKLNVSLFNHTAPKPVDGESWDKSQKKELNE